MKPSISFIGAGNVTFRFSHALHEKGYTIDKIFNRSQENAKKVIRMLSANGSDAAVAASLDELFDSSIIIIAVTDKQLPEVVSNLLPIAIDRTESGKKNPIFLHTCGAEDIAVFNSLVLTGCKCGVLYPLMTLNRNKNVEFKDVPLLLEVTESSIEPVLEAIATDLGSEHYFYSSKDRLKMHVSAVFTCNFVNYMLTLAFEIVGRDQPLLLPGTVESVRNSFLHSPQAALTGPAKRGDLETIEKHLNLLKEMGMEEQAQLYSLISENIMKRQKDK